MSDRGRKTIRCVRKGPALRVTLNRPGVLNAIDGTMLVELRGALCDAASDRAIRVIRIDSACEKAFSAGIDVAYVKDMHGIEAREVGRELHRTFLALRTTGKPIVCVIDGLCLGAGLELAVSCDFMIASDRARFGLPNIHRGIPAIVEAAILPLCIGIQGAREMAYLGEYWDAAKAERRGLVQQVVPAEGLEAAVSALCAKLAGKSPTALGTQKEIIHKWMTTDLESAIDFSINTVMLNFMTRDQKEGMAAFLEKRRAEFTGK
ncbi:MAG: enoyl-CoA hydratase/isomerase family protein [Deltaproteobacteria bacterium]|nr:enoyl-CoA hydratase/isomerase family protein [Deltaproteobacteria bacterium]